MTMIAITGSIMSLNGAGGIATTIAGIAEGYGTGFSVPLLKVD